MGWAARAMLATWASPLVVRASGAGRIDCGSPSEEVLSRARALPVMRMTLAHPDQAMPDARCDARPSNLNSVGTAEGRVLGLPWPRQKRALGSTTSHCTRHLKMRHVDQQTSRLARPSWTRIACAIWASTMRRLRIWSAKRAQRPSAAHTRSARVEMARPAQPTAIVAHRLCLGEPPRDAVEGAQHLAS